MIGIEQLIAFAFFFGTPCALIGAAFAYVLHEASR